MSAETTFRAMIQAFGDADTQRMGPLLAMVEIKAERKGRTLHNHAGFLARVNDADQITELWMVDALPEYSDEFWS